MTIADAIVQKTLQDFARVQEELRIRRENTLRGLDENSLVYRAQKLGFDEGARATADALNRFYREIMDAIKQLPLEVQTAQCNVIVPSEVYALLRDKNLSGEQKTKELATLLAGGEIESSWAQIRRVLYIIAKQLNEFSNLDVTVLCGILSTIDGSIAPTILISFVLSMVYQLGDPEAGNKTLKEK